MNAREYLNRAYKLDNRIKSKLAQVQSLNEMATKVTSGFNEAPVSGTRNVGRVQDVITKIIDLETEINADIDSLVDIKAEIMALVKKVTEIDCQLILEMRYLCYQSWEQIAVDLNYSIHHVYKIHTQALEICDRILNDTK